MKSDKNKIISVSFIIIAMFVITFLFFNYNKEDVILKINGIDVVKEEYILFLNDEKAITADYFYKKYGAEVDKDFWNKEFSNEKPLNHIEKLTQDALVRIKVIQKIAKDENIINTLDFKQLLKESERDSKYGTNALTEFQAYTLFNSNLELEIRNKFIAENDVDEKVLKDKYNELIETNFVQNPKIFATELKITFQNESITNTDTLSKIYTDFSKNLDLDTIKDKYSGLCDIEYREIEFGNEHDKKESVKPADAFLEKMLNNVEIGEILIEEFDSDYYLVKVNSKEDGRVIPYSEAKDTVENFVKIEMFDEYINEKVESSKVEVINTSFFENEIFSILEK